MPLLLGSMFTAPGIAGAAESYDNCTGLHGMVSGGTGNTYGIRRSAGSFAVITRNVLIGGGEGTGIQCNQSGIDSIKDNVILNFESGVQSCADDGGNVAPNSP